VTDLERIGDEAVNIAERAERCGSSRLVPRTREGMADSPSRCSATPSMPS
jgi:phosphate uptake regulator